MGMTRDLSSGRSRPGVDVPVPAAIGALMAPVVACLRGDDDDVRVLFDGACEDGTIEAALRAAPAVARVYLRLAPPPDGIDRILSGYIGGALDRFGDREVVAIGAECLEVARVDQRARAGRRDRVRRLRARARTLERARRRGRLVLVVCRTRCLAAGNRPRQRDHRDLPLPRRRAR